ncbi:1-aminocyclopropane-1-carboxylate synthase 7-like protein [Tanacetum coccineum]
MAIEIVQLSNIAISETHGENSPYSAGWKAYDENPYHEKDNPSGVIQMGLAENQVNTNAPSPIRTLKLSYICMKIRDLTGLVLLERVSFDLVEGYLEANQEAASWGKNVYDFRENALFQDYHGLLTFRKAMASFLEEMRGGKAKFDPERVVLTVGATAANELLTFILANPGDALLVPTPYYPWYNCYLCVNVILLEKTILSLHM